MNIEDELHPRLWDNLGDALGDFLLLRAEVTRLRRLIDYDNAERDKLRALEEAGVDNWEGYSYAMSILAGEEY